MQMRGAARGSLQRYSAVPSAAAQAGRVWDDTASASQGDVVEKRQGPSGGLSGSRRAKPRRMLGTFSVIVFVVASAVAVALVAMRSGKRGKCQTLLRALGLGSIVSAFTNKVGLCLLRARPVNVFQLKMICTCHGLLAVI